MRLLRLWIALGLLCTPMLAQEGVSGTWTLGPGSLAWITWKAPVAAVVNLPASGNTLGDARVVTDLSVLYTWDGSAWQLAGGGIPDTIQDADGDTFVVTDCFGGDSDEICIEAPGSISITGETFFDDQANFSVVSADGQIRADDGTEALPGIASRTDLDTGIRILSDQIDMSTGGVNRFILDSAGDITTTGDLTISGDFDTGGGMYTMNSGNRLNIRGSSGTNSTWLSVGISGSAFFEVREGSNPGANLNYGYDLMFGNAGCVEWWASAYAPGATQNSSFCRVDANTLGVRDSALTGWDNLEAGEVITNDGLTLSDTADACSASIPGKMKYSSGLVYVCSDDSGGWVWEQLQFVP